MCGICGIVSLNNSSSIDKETVSKMRDVLSHRGPDDTGIYCDEKIGFASQRLSILDLSPRGHMPMSSENGRYWIVHNGEIYNFREIRTYLENKGFRFYSQTDAEALLNLFIAEGVAMLSRCNGMFAFAIWDAYEKCLFLARDRVGIKPLYYSVYEGNLYFASEQKAFFAAGVPAIFNKEVWAELLFFRYVSGERTPYKGIYRLLPGHYLFLKNGQIKIRQWWSLKNAVQDQEFKMVSLRKAIECFQELFEDSISLHRISDVPIGVLLSGGLDSSSIAASIVHQAKESIASFTVRFRESAYDEGPLAKEVARHCGFDYNELFLSPNEIPSLLEEATWFLDEPLVHAQDPYLLAISRYAKPKVTVLLSGEGADEFLGGYVHYQAFLYNRLSPLMGRSLKMLDRFLLLKNRWRKMAYIFSYLSSLHRIIFSSADIFPDEIGEIDKNFLDTLAFRYKIAKEAEKVYKEPVRQAMYYEQHTYLQSLLDRNDRMTMAASIECRLPYLDYRIIEQTANLPTRAFFLCGKGKQLLRKAMQHRLPPNALRYQKWGFSVPWHKYLREIPSLRSWVQKLPQHKILLDSSFPLAKVKVNEIVHQYLKGDDRYTSLVRQLTMITLWYDICISKKRGVLS